MRGAAESGHSCHSSNKRATLWLLASSQLSRPPARGNGWWSPWRIFLRTQLSSEIFFFHFTHQATQNKTKPIINKGGGCKHTGDRKPSHETISKSAEVLQYLTSTWGKIQTVNCILPYSNYALASVSCMTAVINSFIPVLGWGHNFPDICIWKHQIHQHTKLPEKKTCWTKAF